MTKNRQSQIVPPPPRFFLAKFILTTTLFLTLALASCKEDGSNSDSNIVGGGSISGGNTITAPVTNTSGETDFNYCWDGTPISSYTPGTSVTISGGNVTIKLGVCPSEYLIPLSELPSGLTANPGSAGILIDDGELRDFWTINDSHILVCVKDKYNQASLVYADRNVTLTGTYTDDHGYTYIYNCSFKKGWNFVVVSTSGTTTTYTTSTTLPSGFTWKVMTKDEYDSYRWD
jgi:hypothetical protein